MNGEKSNKPLQPIARDNARSEWPHNKPSHATREGRR